MSLKIKYQNITEFSLYRYLIPQICNYQGKAIYLDSDVLCLADIGELFDTNLNGYDFLAKKEAYAHSGTKLWGLSVMLIDCQRCRFNLDTYFEEIADGMYSHQDFSCMSPTFLKQHRFAIGELDPNWNVFDSWDFQTKLIHYTNLYTQPWKAANHPHGELWFQYLYEALDQGFVTEADIDLSLLRSYVRPDIRQGNSPKMPNSKGKTSIKGLLRPFKKLLQK